jgi:uncharacterized membrane protein
MTQDESGSAPAGTGEKDAAVGPVQILVVGFEKPRFTGEILPELRRLQDAGLIRLIDLLVVIKDENGDIKAAEVSGLSEEERMAFGAIAGALVGFGAAGEEGIEQGAIAGALDMADGAFDERDVWAIEDAIPRGSAAAIAILEHRWATPFRDAVLRAGGVSLADAWVHPLDLVAAGLKSAQHVPS